MCRTRRHVCPTESLTAKAPPLGPPPAESSHILIRGNHHLSALEGRCQPQNLQAASRNCETGKARQGTLIMPSTSSEIKYLLCFI